MARFAGRYGELDEVVTNDNPQGQSERTFDLSSMATQDASKHLFGLVDWDEFLRAGVFLSQTEVYSLRFLISFLIIFYLCVCLVPIVRESTR